MSGVSTIQIPPGTTSVLVDTRPAVSKLLQLPSVIANPGRVLMIKDFYGTAGNNPFTISTTGTDYIEDVIRSYTFSNSFGSMNLISDGATSWRFIGSYDGTATSTMNVVNRGVMASTIPTSAFVVQLDVTSTIKTLTLPVVSTNAGRMLVIKDTFGKSGASTIVLSTVGTDRFEMSSCSTFALSHNYGSWTLLNDAVNTWYLSEFYRNTLTVASGPISIGGSSVPIISTTLVLNLDAVSYGGSTTWTALVGNNYTVSGGPLTTANSPNGSQTVVFNGSQYAQDLTGITSSVISTYTFDIWFYAASGASGNMVGELGQASQGGWNVMMMSVSGNTIYVGFWQGSVYQLSLGTYTANTWTHVCYTYSGSTVTGYVNGVYVAVGSGGKQWPSAAYYGVASSANPYGNLACRIGAFKIYSSALTAIQIKQNYNALAPRFGLATI